MTAPAGFNVALKFEDYQVADYGSANQDVTVAYDGTDKTAQEIINIRGRKEGKDKPELVVASGNTLHLTFESNSKTTNKGFKVKAYALAKCDYNIQLGEETETITSFNYPGNSCCYYLLHPSLKETQYPLP